MTKIARPTATPPPNINLRSPSDVQHYLAAHDFPFAEGGRFHFAFVDPQQQTKHVWLRHGLAGYRHAPAFHSCGEGVFLLSLHAPAVHRLEYRFTLIDAAGNERTIADPRSPFTVRDPFTEKSVAFAPEYAVPIHIGPPCAEARGRIDELVLPGPAGRSWNTLIWHPPDARADEALPLILFLDGGDYLHYAGLRHIIENLQHAHRLARCRAVFISPAQRNEEYAANPRTAEHLATVIPAELGRVIPISNDPSQRIGVGASLGGLCLLHAHLTQPQFFGGLVLQSGSFFQPDTDSMEVHFEFFDRIIEFVGSALREPAHAARIPIAMTCGRGGENIANNRVMARSLHDHGFDVSLHEHPDAHNWTSWRDCVGEQLVRLLPRH